MTDQTPPAHKTLDQLTHEEAMAEGARILGVRLAEQAIVDYYIANHPSRPKEQSDATTRA